MELNTKQIGTITEYQCATYLMNLGCNVSFPLGEFAPYDFIFEFNKKLYRVQVKHATVQPETFTFICTKMKGSVQSKLYSINYESNDFEYFGTYFDGKCYLIPISECNQAKTLRFKIHPNLQRSNICWAVNYEADYILEKLINDNAQPRLNMDEELENLKLKTYKKEIDYNNSQYGTMWITNGSTNKKIKRMEEIPEGFYKGRICK